MIHNALQSSGFYIYLIRNSWITGINIYLVSLQSWNFKIDIVEPSREEILYDCPKNEWFFDTKIKIHPDPINLSSWELQLIQNTPFFTYSRYFCIDRTTLHCAIHDSWVHRDSQAKSGNHTVGFVESPLCFAFGLPELPAVWKLIRFECVRTLNVIVFWPRCRAWHSVTTLCISIGLLSHTWQCRRLDGCRRTDAIFYNSCYPKSKVCHDCKVLGATQSRGVHDAGFGFLCCNGCSTFIEHLSYTMFTLVVGIR